ncbi:MAG TPA: tetratricopeptide repeat protein [Gemmataceae bacterium]|nr:tetratricopeptide repeat protein [Gemmataceae bacterium]
MLLLVGFLACEGWAFWQERSARQAMNEEHFDEAQRHIDLALRVPHRSASAHLLAARIARQRGAYSEAEQHLSRCGQLSGMTEAVRLEWLLLRCQRGEADELAPTLLSLVAGNHAESVAMLESLASVYMRQARYLEALRCLDQWVERAADSARAFDWRGWVDNQLEHRDQAIHDYERSLELQPGRSAVRLRLAQILVKSSRYGEAVPHLERLRTELPDNPDVLTALAHCWMALSRTEEARTLLGAVLEAHPDHFEALLQRGNLELSDDHLPQAEGWLRKALEREPQDVEARYSLYRCLQAQPNRQQEAQKELARWEKDRRIRERLTRLLRTELAAKPDDAKLAKEAGELFRQLGEEKRGAFWLQRAAALEKH